jgi:hypothetical protein
MPSASSAEVVEAALGLGSFAGTVKERRRPAFETASAFSGVEGAVEEDMIDESLIRMTREMAGSDQLQGGRVGLSFVGGWKSRLMLAHRQAL